MDNLREIFLVGLRDGSMADEGMEKEAGGATSIVQAILKAGASGEKALMAGKLGKLAERGYSADALKFLENVAGRDKSAHKEALRMFTKGEGVFHRARGGQGGVDVLSRMDKTIRGFVADLSHAPRSKRMLRVRGTKTAASTPMKGPAKERVQKWLRDRPFRKGMTAPTAGAVQADRAGFNAQRRMQTGADSLESLLQRGIVNVSGGRVVGGVPFGARGRTGGFVPQASNRRSSWNPFSRKFYRGGARGTVATNVAPNNLAQLRPGSKARRAGGGGVFGGAPASAGAHAGTGIPVPASPMPKPTAAAGAAGAEGAANPLFNIAIPSTGAGTAGQAGQAGKGFFGWGKRMGLPSWVEPAAYGAAGVGALGLGARAMSSNG